MVRVGPDNSRWHDKSFDFARPFTCDHCGADGEAIEADARCDKCGRTTRLEIEVRDER